ncbi:MAG: aspartate dehydrogenase [Nitrososphaeraceae archaeon]
MIKKISIIGCGTIGTELAIWIDQNLTNNVEVISLFDIDEKALLNLKHKLVNNNPETYTKFSDFLSSTSINNIDIIIESASQKALQSYLLELIKLKKDVLVMSVGAFTDVDFYHDIVKNISDYKVNIYIPSGAIAGIDAIKSVSEQINSITLITTKHPKSFEGAHFFEYSDIRLGSIKKKTILFEGSVVDAVKNFPANVNVAALLGLCGIGFEKTKVKVIADPYIKINKHEIKVTGKFGEMIIKVKNVPSYNNPKTSQLAILSAIECLRSIVSKGIKYGT